MQKELTMFTKSARLSLLAGFALVALGVTACQEPPPPEPKLSAEPAAIEVDKNTTTHKLQVDGGGRPSDLEKHRLKAFIADTGGSRPESLHVTINGSRPEAQLRSIKNLLVADGVTDSKIVIASSAAGKSGGSSTVTISVDRFVAVAPHCPPWSTGEVATNDNSTRPNLGCANLANFAAMVADPEDLVAGSSSRYGDGKTAAAAVQRYDEDKLKELPKSNEGFIAGSK